MNYSKVLFFIYIAFFLTACSHKVTDKPLSKQASTTQLPAGKAPILSYLNKTDKKLSDNSAYYSLSSPEDALAARLFLIDNATTSLDVQYYIYEADSIGKVFTAHLLLAAQRGVKVRILIDDLGTSGKDEQWQKLASHPNIELRLFNPNRFRTYFRNLALLFNVDTLGKRMHNKSLIADGAAAIVGGRNIGDDYYASNTSRLFLDYDVLAIGNVVPDIYQAFDIYWNSDEAVPSEYVLESTKRTYHFYKKELLEAIKAYEQSPAGKAIVNSDFNRKIGRKELILTVAEQTDFYYDPPSKVNTAENETADHISSQLNKVLTKVNRDLIIISPYFIPSNKLMEEFKNAREKGKNIIVITNSLASTDVFPVYSAYQDDIKPLVEMGVELYELKPNSFKSDIRGKKWANPNSISLHTKMIIFDNDRLGVGSANMDPRSSKLNTELFMIISSEELTSMKREMLDEVIDPKNFYQLSWGKYPKEFDDDAIRYGPVWITVEEGDEKIYYAPPHAGFWKRLGSDILSLFPIRGYL